MEWMHKDWEHIQLAVTS